LYNTNCIRLYFEKILSLFPAIPDFIRLLHGNTKNKKYLVKEFIAFWDKKMHPEVDVEAETEHDRCQISIGNGITVLRELASWEACPDEGAFQGRLCWWVPKEVREQHQLLDLPLPNAWSYILKPAAKRVRTPKEKQKEAAKPAVAEEAMASPEPLPTDTPPKSAKESLITKFTKVLSAEERLKQLEADKLKAKEKKEAKILTTPFSAGSAFFIKPSTSTPSPSTAAATKPDAPADQKKGRRVSLLFSVPRGQAIPSSQPATAFTPVVPSNSKKDDDDVQLLN
jgi:chromatin assembly factor 1 subunit A